jgi:peptide deformylase
MDMTLTVKICGDPVLRKIASPVEEFDAELRKLAEAMIETMRTESGIGLAAPQVNVSKRLIIARQMTDFDDSDAQPLVLVNPQVIRVSKDTWVYEEGCLSVPGITASVVRPQEVDVRYQDLNGQVHTVSASGIFGRILLHEIDHLDGKLFIDYLSSAQKSLIKSKLKDLTQNRA